jgi:hypothetical protein
VCKIVAAACASGPTRLAGRPQGVEDLRDEDSVYVSWYTFTRLCNEVRFEILSRRTVLSIMPGPVRVRMAAAGVGADHDWIGHKGARLLHKHLTAPQVSKPDRGRLDVLVSPLR